MIWKDGYGTQHLAEPDVERTVCGLLTGCMKKLDADGGEPKCPNCFPDPMKSTSGAQIG